MSLQVELCFIFLAREDSVFAITISHSYQNPVSHGNAVISIFRGPLHLMPSFLIHGGVVISEQLQGKSGQLSE